MRWSANSPNENEGPENYTLCMCGSFVSDCFREPHVWRQHIKCLGRDNAAKFDGTRREVNEFYDWKMTVRQWHDTFTVCEHTEH